MVVLPQPDSPTRPKVSPLRMENDTSETALTLPTLRWSTTPDVTGNSFTKSIHLEEHRLALELFGPGPLVGEHRTVRPDLRAQHAVTGGDRRLAATEVCSSPVPTG